MDQQHENYEAYAALATEDGGKPVELIEQEGKATLVGYAVVWGAASSPRGDGYRHRFNRGSITWAPTVNALYEHSPAHPLGSTANGTLRVTEDDYGARVEIDLDLETTLGRDVHRYVTTRLVRGMSFGGAILDHVITAQPQVKDITRFAGREVTVTLVPAMTETVIATAENFADIEKEKQRRAAKNKLAGIKLALYRPGAVSG